MSTWVAPPCSHDVTKLHQICYYDWWVTFQSKIWNDHEYNSMCHTFHILKVEYNICFLIQSMISKQILFWNYKTIEALSTDSCQIIVQFLHFLEKVDITKNILNGISCFLVFLNKVHMSWKIIASLDCFLLHIDVDCIWRKLMIQLTCFHNDFSVDILINILDEVLDLEHRI